MALYDCWSRKPAFASLVHFSIDILLCNHKQAIVKLGLLFENRTGRALRDSEFSIRLPDEARVSSVECEVERAEGNLLLRVPDKRLEGSSGLNISKAHAFVCHIGRVGSDRDVIVFLEYKYNPLYRGDQVYLSLPPPQRLFRNIRDRHKFRVNLESEEPYQISSIISPTQEIKTVLTDNKATVIITNSTNNGNIELTITRNAKVTVTQRDKSSPIHKSPQEAPSPYLDYYHDIHMRVGSDENLRYSSTPIPPGYAEEKINPRTTIEKLNSQGIDIPEPMQHIQRSSSCGSSETYYSTSSFFLADGDSASESDFDFEPAEGKPENHKSTDFVASDPPYGPRLKIGVFETEAAWLAGALPITSWLEISEDIEDADQPTETENLVGCKVETATITNISIHKPRVVNISGNRKPLSCPATPTPIRESRVTTTSTPNRISRLLGNQTIRSNEEPISTAETFSIPASRRRALSSPICPSSSFGLAATLLPHPPPCPTVTDSSPLLTLRSLSDQLRASPSLFFQLNQTFSSTVGVPLSLLVNHKGAQSSNPSLGPSWVRFGLWANAVALEFLRLYCSINLLQEDIILEGGGLDGIKREFNGLYYRIWSPVVGHNWYRSREGNAGLTFSELRELARGLLGGALGRG